MRTAAMIAVAAISTLLVGPAIAEGSSTSSTPENSASPGKEGEKMKTGDTKGSAPNSSNPGSSAGADGNQTQDSRMTKTKDR